MGDPEPKAGPGLTQGQRPGRRCWGIFVGWPHASPCVRTWGQGGGQGWPGQRGGTGQGKSVWSCRVLESARTAGHSARGKEPTVGAGEQAGLSSGQGASAEGLPSCNPTCRDTGEPSRGDPPACLGPEPLGEAGWGQHQLAWWLVPWHVEQGRPSEQHMEPGPALSVSSRALEGTGQTALGPRGGGQSWVSAPPGSQAPGQIWPPCVSES